MKFEIFATNQKSHLVLPGGSFEVKLHNQLCGAGAGASTGVPVVLEARKPLSLNPK